MNYKLLSVTTLLAATMFSASPLTRAADNDDKKPSTERPNRRANAEERLNKFAKEANLSDEQKQKVKGILDQEQAKMRELRQDTALSQEDRRTKMRDLRKETDAKVKAVLKDDQYEKWEKMRAQGGGQRRRQAPQ